MIQHLDTIDGVHIGLDLDTDLLVLAGPTSFVRLDVLALADRIRARPRTCATCGADLKPQRTGRPRKTCSTRCRVAKHREEHR